MLQPLLISFILVGGCLARLESSELFDYIQKQCEIGVPAARASWEYAGQNEDIGYGAQKLYRNCACTALQNTTHCYNVMGVLAQAASHAACPLDGGHNGEAANQFCGCMCSGNSATYKPAMAMAGANVHYLQQVQYDCEKCCMPHLSHDRFGVPPNNPHNLPIYEDATGIKDSRTNLHLYNLRLNDNYVYKNQPNTHQQGHYLEWCPYKIDIPV